MGHLHYHERGIFIVLSIPLTIPHSPIYLQSSLPLSHQTHPLSMPGFICHRLSNPDHALCTVLQPQAPYLTSVTLRDLNGYLIPGSPTQMLQLQGPGTLLVPSFLCSSLLSKFSLYSATAFPAVFRLEVMSTGHCPHSLSLSLPSFPHRILGETTVLLQN